MKKLILALYVMVSLGQALQADTIVVAAYVWEPYNSAEGAVPEGYLLDILRAVFEKQGHVIKYQVMPYSRALVLAKDGDIQAVLGTFATDAAEYGLLNTQASLGLSKTVFLVKKADKWRFKGLKSLEDRVVGAILGYTYGDEGLDGYLETFKADPKRVSLVAGDDPVVANFRKLEVGRVNVLVEDSVVAQYVMAKNNWTNQFVFAGEIGQGTPLYVSFSSKSPKVKAWLKLLDQGIADLRASGQLAKILARYGLKDWE